MRYSSGDKLLRNVYLWRMFAEYPGER